MSMMKQIVCGTLIGVAALGAGRARASQPVPQTPAVAPRVIPAPQVPPTPMIPPIVPAPAIAPPPFVWQELPPPPAQPPQFLQFELPPLPAFFDFVPTAPIPPMPAIDIDATMDSARLALAQAKFALAPFAKGGLDDREDQLYDRARDAIENGRYERALADLERLISINGTRTDAALYWKVYSLAKIGQRADALTTVADLEKRFSKSAWLKDAKALEVEIRQSSGQNPSPESQADEETKLMAMRGVMQADPERGVPMIEKLLSGTSSIKIKEQALFLLTQSRSNRAREIISNVAKGGSNPDLQLRAIRYIGMMGGTESRQILDDAYRSTPDPAVKRTIIRSFMTSNDRARLLSVAKTEKDDALRGEAVRQLGNIRAGAELSELYQSEHSIEVKKQILQGMFQGGFADKLIELAKGEKDPELRRTAIRYLGNMRRTETTDALVGIYASDANVDVRKAIISALFTQNNAKALVDIARAEKNPEMKKDIVSKLSNMKSKEAIDYMLELIK
jgi:tetratricopeptide (TPR) repeat protein